MVAPFAIALGVNGIPGTRCVRFCQPTNERGIIVAMITSDVAEFQRVVWEYYGANKRDMPWRQPGADGVFDPYGIMVSEVMLQQTQVARVIPKYQDFLHAFPAVHDLAAAELGDVLRLWNGLGYNRRAKYLWQAAQYAVAQWQGALPADQAQLTHMPGIGPNTAGAICAYAFDVPVVFIETNIRTALLHHFFPRRTDVPDVELLPLVQASVPQPGVAGRGPREWYWALMDYGAYLKATVGNMARASRHYAKQSTFQGSVRQLRGEVLRQLAVEPKTLHQLQQATSDPRLLSVVAALAAEGMIRISGHTYML